MQRRKNLQKGTTCKRSREQDENGVKEKRKRDESKRRILKNGAPNFALPPGERKTKASQLEDFRLFMNEALKTVQELQKGLKIQKEPDEDLDTFSTRVILANIKAVTQKKEEDQKAGQTSAKLLTTQEVSREVKTIIAAPNHKILATACAKFPDYVSSLLKDEKEPGLKKEKEKENISMPPLVKIPRSVELLYL
jgi:hypothetical protein